MSVLLHTFRYPSRVGLPNLTTPFLFHACWRSPFFPTSTPTPTSRPSLAVHIFLCLLIVSVTTAGDDGVSAAALARARARRRGGPYDREAGGSGGTVRAAAGRGPKGESTRMEERESRVEQSRNNSPHTYIRQALLQPCNACTENLLYVTRTRRRSRRWKSQGSLPPASWFSFGEKTQRYDNLLQRRVD